MTIYSQVLLSIAVSLSTVTPLIAAEITYSDYAKAPDTWKRGFVFGISQYLSAVAQPDEEPPFPVRSAYQRCLTGPTDAILARHLEGYVARNPPSPKEPMIRVALRAMFDFCRSEIEKTQPSKRDRLDNNGSGSSLFGWTADPTPRGAPGSSLRPLDGTRLCAISSGAGATTRETGRQFGPFESFGCVRIPYWPDGVGRAGALSNVLRIRRPSGTLCPGPPGRPG
jgi:hypothetical protein